VELGQHKPSQVILLLSVFTDEATAGKTEPQEDVRSRNVGKEEQAVRL
jgi:hypothetical protein